MSSKKERKVPCFDFTQPETFVHIEDQPFFLVILGSAVFSGAELEQIVQRGVQKYGDALHLIQIQFHGGSDVSISYSLHSSRCERVSREELRRESGS